MILFKKPWILGVLAAAAMPISLGRTASAETVRDRLWIWGHPAGVYNTGFLQPIQRTSKIEPVDAARLLGLKNMIFVRYDGKPVAPFEDYYRPFGALDRVYWSLVAAGGDTSRAEREGAFVLAEKNKNLAGFVLDDFFHEPSEGNAADPLPIERQWLAANQPEFPVTFTVTLQQPVKADSLELVQTHWHTGDYRAKEVAVDTSVDGKTWQQVATGTLANEPQAVLSLAFPSTRFAGVRIRFLGTHDKDGALSVGLAGLRLLASGKALDSSAWKAAASSSYPGYDPNAPLVPEGSSEHPFRASLSPTDLRAIHQRRVRGAKLPVMAVIYTRQVKPRAKAHVAEVDQLCLWTWRPQDLRNLEANLTALEQIAPRKEIFLGCYMYDFHQCKPLPVPLMRQQVELGHRWLRTGRISGMIFLATPNVDVGLEAVDWTREWIRATGDQALPMVSSPKPGP